MRRDVHGAEKSAHTSLYGLSWLDRSRTMLLHASSIPDRGLELSKEPALSTFYDGTNTRCRCKNLGGASDQLRVRESSFSQSSVGPDVLSIVLAHLSVYYGTCCQW